MSHGMRSVWDGLVRGGIETAENDIIVRVTECGRENRICPFRYGGETAGRGKTDGLPMMDRSFKPAAILPRLREEDQK